MRGSDRKRRISACLLAAMASVLVGASPGGETRTVDGFGNLRHEVLEFIGGATQRIWLISDYLTDGEIVSSLYLARYRKLDVQVLLGKAKANSYMSRLNYLKNQKIPVFLKPPGFKITAPSAILADNRLVYIDGELDFLAKLRKYQLTFPDADETSRFEQEFAAAAEKQVPAIPHPVPLVGRPSKGGQTAGGQPTPARLPRVEPRYDPSTDTYTYDKSDAVRPAHLPSALPKGTIWEQKLKGQESP